MRVGQIALLACFVLGISCRKVFTDTQKTCFGSIPQPCSTTTCSDALKVTDTLIETKCQDILDDDEFGKCVYQYSESTDKSVTAYFIEFAKCFTTISTSEKFDTSSQGRTLSVSASLIISLLLIIFNL